VKICVHRKRESESSSCVRTWSWFVMEVLEDAGGKGRVPPNKPPPRRGIRLRKTRRCVWRATVNSRRGSLSARNAFTSKSIINPTIGMGRRAIDPYPAGIRLCKCTRDRF
jgi:hypothetical protein